MILGLEEVCEVGHRVGYYPDRGGDIDVGVGRDWPAIEHFSRRDH